MTRLDWPGLMRVGIGQLGLAPEVFWRLTPAELHMLAGPDQPGPVPFTRARLDALVQAFPDRMKGDADDRDRESVRKNRGS
jgi:uncharacterized phage protein (TIGR02216 family)